MPRPAPIANVPARIATLAAGLACAASPALATADESPDGWWHDAVFYEVFVRSFADSTEGPLAGDGVGDIPGLIERLDELNDGEPGGDDLGVTALWLMPIAQSPSYHGYDVVDYTRVDDEYGTNDDFKRLIEECEKRGMRVIVDLVLNHCSWEHPWFEAAADPESPYHDFFIWRETKPDWEHNLHMWRDNKIEQTGEYYYGFFSNRMPDLNFDNPFVSATAYDISRTWLDDLGAHGFRLDAIRHLIERGETVSSTPETIAWLEDWHRYVRSIAPGAFTVGEVWGPTSEVRQYLPNAIDSAFEFQLAETIVAGVNSGDAADLAGHIAHLNEAYDGAPFSTFLTNHDQDRLMSQLSREDDEPGGDAVAKNKLAASLLLTLPGTPFLYYGEEIGMTGVKPDPDLRTPMQWTADPERTGFTTGKPWRDVNADTQTINVESQKADRGSLWNHYKKMVELRLGTPALRRGETAVLETSDPALLAFTRTLDGERVLVLANMGDRPMRSFEIESPAFEPDTLVRSELLEGAGRVRAKRSGEDGTIDAWQPVSRLGARRVVVLRLN